MKAYHWLTENMTSGCGDEPAWAEGEERTLTGTIALCERGYHSSPSPFDGLEYAPRPVLCLVEVSDPVGKDDTKSVSATRKLIKAINVEQQLREFACDVAEEALNREVQAGRTVDERSRAAIEVARRFARKQATPDELDAARVAARVAAWAAWAAADAAAWAARAAAWAAARDAAWAAAGAAAWAARAAARDARAAARAAARDAARDAQKVKFDATMTALFETVPA